MRQTTFERKSKETEIEIKLNIDGKGQTTIKTPIGLLDHMLELFAFWGLFDLELSVKGDTHIDIHHTNEDIGIALGKTFKQALGEDLKGIKRFGSAFAPMESTLGHTVVDLSGRGHLSLLLDGKKAGDLPAISNQGDYTFIYLEHFLESFAKLLGANIIINIKNPDGSGDISFVS